MSFTTLDETLAALHPTQRDGRDTPGAAAAARVRPGQRQDPHPDPPDPVAGAAGTGGPGRHPGPHVLAGRRGRAARAARPGPRPAGARTVGRDVPWVRRLAPAPAWRPAGPHGGLHDLRPRGHAPADRAARGGARPRGRPRDPGRGGRAGEGPADASGGACGGVPPRSARRAAGRLRDPVPGSERVRLHGPAGRAARPLPTRTPRSARGCARASARVLVDEAQDLCGAPARARRGPRGAGRRRHPGRATTTRRSTGGGAAT